MLLQDLLTSTAARLPEKEALVIGSKRVTWRELSERASRLAGFLVGSGLQRGDRVAIFSENSIETVIGLFAAMRAGGVFMLVNPLTKQDKLAYMLNDARAAALLTQAELTNVFLGALSANKTVGCVVVHGLGQQLGPRTDMLDWDAAEATGHTLPAGPSAIDADLASIIYTSGSTGDPKGVMLTHLNMLTAANSVSQYLGLRESDRIYCALPLAFDYGLYQVLMATKVGATVILDRSFSFPARSLELMAKEQATVFPGVPTMFAMLMRMESLSDFDLSLLRMITNTAAALAESQILATRKMFPRAQLFSMYGLTECKRVTYLPPEQLDVRPTSVGRGMPNEEVWLVDEEGKRLPNGSTGELVIRGSHVMRGYWEKPEATAERLKPGPLPGEMLLYSGDLFRTDDEGYLYFIARKDDIIKSRGEKVSPREVENVIWSLTGVSEAAVIGVPDDLLGQAIKAFIVVKEGQDLTARDVVAHCRDRLESFMVPKYVEFVDELPKTDTGKVRKKSLA
jgi:amino acid adenylation domain-containing protein